MALSRKGLTLANNEIQIDFVLNRMQFRHHFGSHLKKKFKSFNEDSEQNAFYF